MEMTHLVDLGSQYTITKPNPLRANDCFQRRARSTDSIRYMATHNEIKEFYSFIEKCSQKQQIQLFI